MKYTVISFDELSRFDSSNVNIFREKLAQVNRDDDAVILDFTGIDFIDSSGLGAVIAVASNKQGWAKLFLCGIKENVRRVMELTRLDTILPLYSSVADVIEILRQKPNFGQNIHSIGEFKKAA